MSLAAFRIKLHLAQYRDKAQVWFPKWLARYATGKPLAAGLLPVTITSSVCVLVREWNLRYNGANAVRRTTGFHNGLMVG